jgi:hypothetical protein
VKEWRTDDCGAGAGEEQVSTKVKDWGGNEIELVASSGGVLAFVNPWDGVIHGGVDPWPPPELVQKLYQSNHAGAFVDAANSSATRFLGYYSDLQSMHSEDAVTWSFFGPIAYADSNVRAKFCEQLLESLGIAGFVSRARIWLWRRLPHPDTRVSGGPEIDFGIQTADTLILGESKWRSGFGAGQGTKRDKDQIQLRVEYCIKHGTEVFPRVTQFIVLAVGRGSNLLTDVHRALGGGKVLMHETTWETLAGLSFGGSIAGDAHYLI